MKDFHFNTGDLVVLSYLQEKWGINPQPCCKANQEDQINVLYFQKKEDIHNLKQIFRNKKKSTIGTLTRDAEVKIMF